MASGYDLDIGALDRRVAQVMFNIRGDLRSPEIWLAQWKNVHNQALMDLVGELDQVGVEESPLDEFLNFMDDARAAHVWPSVEQLWRIVGPWTFPPPPMRRKPSHATGLAPTLPSNTPMGYGFAAPYGMAVANPHASTSLPPPPTHRSQFPPPPPAMGYGMALGHYSGYPPLEPMRLPPGPFDAGSNNVEEQSHLLDLRGKKRPAAPTDAMEGVEGSPALGEAGKQKRQRRDAGEQDSGYGERQGDAGRSEGNAEREGQIADVGKRDQKGKGREVQRMQSADADNDGANDATPKAKTNMRNQAGIRQGNRDERDPLADSAAVPTSQPDIEDEMDVDQGGKNAEEVGTKAKGAKATSKKKNRRKSVAVITSEDESKLTAYVKESGLEEERESSAANEGPAKSKNAEVESAADAERRRSANAWKDATKQVKDVQKKKLAEEKANQKRAEKAEAAKATSVPTKTRAKAATTGAGKGKTRAGASTESGGAEASEVEGSNKAEVPQKPIRKASAANLAQYTKRDEDPCGQCKKKGINCMRLPSGKFACQHCTTAKQKCGHERTPLTLNVEIPFDRAALRALDRTLRAAWELDETVEDEEVDIQGAGDEDDDLGAVQYGSLVERLPPGIPIVVSELSWMRGDLAELIARQSQLDAIATEQCVVIGEMQEELKVARLELRISERRARAAEQSFAAGHAEIQRKLDVLLAGSAPQVPIPGPSVRFLQGSQEHNPSSSPTPQVAPRPLVQKPARPAPRPQPTNPVEFEDTDGEDSAADAAGSLDAPSSHNSRLSSPTGPPTSNSGTSRREAHSTAIAKAVVQNPVRVNSISGGGKNRGTQAQTVGSSKGANTSLGSPLTPLPSLYQASASSSSHRGASTKVDLDLSNESSSSDEDENAEEEEPAEGLRRSLRKKSQK